MPSKQGKSESVPEYLAEYFSWLPPGTKYGLDRAGACATFGFPFDGEVPGWVAVLRFLSRNGAIDLAAFEVAYFADPIPPRPAPGVNRFVDAMPELSQEQRRTMTLDAFGEWVERKALEPAPVHVPDGGLVITRLRDVRVGDFQTAARKYLKRDKVQAILPPSWGTEAQRRSGMPGKDDLHFAQLAQAYVEMEGRARVERLTEHLNFASKSTVRNQLAEARARGLLTSPGQGRAGGQLTDKAKGILDGDH